MAQQNIGKTNRSWASSETPRFASASGFSIESQRARMAWLWPEDIHRLAEHEFLGRCPLPTRSNKSDKTKRRTMNDLNSKGASACCHPHAEACQEVLGGARLVESNGSVLCSRQHDVPRDSSHKAHVLWFASAFGCGIQPLETALKLLNFKLESPSTVQQQRVA